MLINASFPHSNVLPLLFIALGCNVSSGPSDQVCGIYRDSCRGGSTASDSDNVVRTLALYGERYGEFVFNQSLYFGFDTDCSELNLNGQMHLYGTFATRGPSDCGGSCVVQA